MARENCIVAFLQTTDSLGDIVAAPMDSIPIGHAESTGVWKEFSVEVRERP
jgi:hypothetical protein